MSGSDGEQIDDLIDQAHALSEAGDEDGALAKYFEALALDVNNPTVLYNPADLQGVQ